MKMNELTVEELNQLEDYACLEGTEIGEYVERILGLRNFNIAHGMTEGFSESLNNELRFWLDRFNNETRIEVTEEPVTTIIKQRELVWYGE
jgi:hypothetical protein